MYKNFRRLFVIYRGVRRPMILSQVLLLCSVVMNLVMMTLTGRLVNEGVQQGNIDVVLNVAVWMIGLSLVQAVFAVGSATLAILFGEGTANYLQVATYRKIQTLSFGNLDRFRTSDLLVRLTLDIMNVRMAVLYSMMILLQAPFTILLAVIMVLLFAPGLFWLMLGSMAVVIVIMAVLLRGFNALYDRRQEKQDAVNNILQEDLAGVRVVKAFVREKYEGQRFATAAGNLRQASLAPAYRIALFVPTMFSLLYATIAALFYVSGRLVLVEQTQNLGTVVVFSQVLITVLVPIMLLAFLLPFLQAGETSLGRIFELMDEKVEVADTAQPQALDLEKVQGRVVFENVSFGYRDRDGKTSGLALKNINLTVEPGETVGFLGATGSGKSSLVNLIPRFYDVVDGKVTIDGVDVRTIPLEQLRQLVGIALQESVLFSGDVRANLLVGYPQADDDEMVAAAKAADAHNFVSAIPEQYDARVARRGANFSGGQRQRLSIARALISRPKILILDDSTSAVDMATEARIQDAVMEMMHQTTKFYVAQRISTVLAADKIVLLENGVQVAVGNHTQLLQSSPLYREIYESQLGKIETKPAAGQANGGAL